MAFKINISEKGKTFKLEADAEYLVGKKIGEKIEGKELKPELEGYELEITGTSDKAGFPGMKEMEGSQLKKILLTKGRFMRTSKPHGLRLKKSVRGNTLTRDTLQVNAKVMKKGSKSLEEIFPEQVKAKENKEEKAEGAAQ